MIEVDVSVTDNDGQPIGDLSRNDFAIIDGNRPQAISAFSYVDIPLGTLRTAVAPQLELEPDVTTNADPETRVYVILMDAPSTASPVAAALQRDSYTMRAKQVAERFVRNAMRSGDQVAVVHARGTFADSQGFTTSRRLIEASINRYGRGLSSNEVGAQAIAFNLDTYRAIEQISTRLGTIRARRKGIVWIGGQIDFFPERATSGFTAAQAATLTFAYRDAMRAAARNNVAVYSVDPTGSTSELGAEELNRMAGLRAVAEDTGGLAVVNTSNFDKGFEAIIRDMSSYYLLGYVPTEDASDGTFRPIRVRVTRPGVTVRARTGYYGGKTLDTQPTPTSDVISQLAAAALARPLPTRGLKVGVVTTVFKAPDIAQPVAISAHVDAEGLTLDPNAALTISYQILDAEGRVAKGHYKVYRLDLRPETRDRAIGSGMLFVDRVTLRPGRYELRLVVEQPDVALGSVVSHVDVPDLNERFDLSGIVLGKHASGNNVALDLTKDDHLNEVLGGDPAILRRFKRTDTLLAFVESYSQVPFAVVNVDGSVVARNGQLVARVSAKPADAYANQDRTSRGHLVTLALGRLEPGDHVLTMTGRSASQPNRVMTRQVRIAIDP